MKRRKITFKAILVMLLTGGLIAVSSWAFAQGSITGSVRDLSTNRGIQGVIITVKDVRTGALAGTGTTDALGNYSVGVHPREITSSGRQNSEMTICRHRMGLSFPV